MSLYTIAGARTPLMGAAKAGIALLAMRSSTTTAPAAAHARRAHHRISEMLLSTPSSRQDSRSLLSRLPSPAPFARQHSTKTRPERRERMDAATARHWSVPRPETMAERVDRRLTRKMHIMIGCYGGILVGIISLYVILGDDGEGPGDNRR
ncbi:hypothetical protein LTR53_000641 [Teratosphaeriaceae sp. CCFEE 6253]|nr:hypothetical protein LTR53_000641 [Teratosphaeriaceae sp. CCFEE 6253]